jgi:pilus assembly protein CpaE
MLRGVIICPDQDLGDRLENALIASRMVGIARRMETYPSMVDLVRFLRATAPQVVFISVESLHEALDVARRVESQAPGTQLVAINRTVDPNTLLETMRAGIREFLSPPFETQMVKETMVRIDESIEQRPPMIEMSDSVFAFLPAKAGAGTTTIAVNTSLALSRIPDSNALLIDLDLNCGLVGFMLLLQSQFSVVDAAENSMEMDENLWPKIVSKVGNLDVLPVGKLAPGFRIENTQIRHILEYARRNYSTIFVDLSGMMEKYSLEILHEAKRVFLVTTAELPSLHLAREKLAFLRAQELDSRVSILLNRSQKRHQISLAEMEKLFGLPIHMTFPNDYAGVHKALTAGKCVDPQSELGSRYRELAETMVTRKTPTVERKRGLLDLLVGKKSEAQA